MTLACASCAAELRATAKFCDECGTPVAGRSATPRTASTNSNSAADAARTLEHGSRKTVTIIFADLAGSTALHERLDPESARSFMENYYRAMTTAVEAHGGKVAKLLGDGVMAVFGLPLVAEDDAYRAVQACVTMQSAFSDLALQYSSLVGEIGLRVAANTGEVVARDETELLGDPVNVAARLQDQAGIGDVVVGEPTRRLVSTLVTLEPLGSVVLKGRAEAMGAYRVVSLDKPASATTAAFVGRVEELGRLTALQKAGVEATATRLAVVLGSPGLGKSRLIDEFVTRIAEGAGVVRANCDAAGGTTFAPLAKSLRVYLGIDDQADDATVLASIDNALPAEFSERKRILDGAAALLGGSPASPEETFFIVRRLLAALTTQQPLVLVIDDLQWAAPLLLDLIEHLVQWGTSTPLLVLVGARPELRTARSALTTTGPLVSEVLTLGGLDAGAATKLAANMIGTTDLPAAVAAKVLAASEGNPLFVGELVRMLVHEGALQRDGDRWVIGQGLAALEMPPTIHALLAARIERLDAADRFVLERAAVIGRQFSRSALTVLLATDSQDLDSRLESLRRSELIEPDPGWYLGEPALRFHHVLIRDAAYRRLLKNTRAELHAGLANWIETKSTSSGDHDQVIGWHLEQAYQHLRELGPVTDAGCVLGERASARLAAAGRRALARDDVTVAADLVGRALHCLDSGDDGRAELTLDWCEALLGAGEINAAAAAIDELDAFATDSARLRAWHACFVGQLTALTAPQSLRGAASRVAAAAEKLAELGDDAGEAKAHSVHAQALARLGQVGACEVALDSALAAARRVGDRRRANAVLSGAPAAALWGPSPVTRASGRCLDVVRVLRITQGAPAVEAVALSCQGVLEALRGRCDAARRMVASARGMVEELGISHRLLEADVALARIDLLEGNTEAAERGLRAAYNGFRELGLGSDAAQAGALLGRALLRQGRAEEAETLSHQSEELAGDDLQAGIAWRCVRAEALAERGEHQAAIEVAKIAVAIAEQTDALLDHADARLALAAAYRSAGQDDQATTEDAQAQSLWEAKGATQLTQSSGSSGSVPASVTAPVAQTAGGAQGSSLGRAGEKLASPPLADRGASTGPATFSAFAATAEAEVFQNQAAQAWLELIRLWSARDWRSFEELLPANFHMDDRRPLVQLDLDREQMIEFTRKLGDMASTNFSSMEFLASRGENLALFRSRLEVADDEVGPSEINYLNLIETNGDGAPRAVIRFDAPDLEAAYAELDRPYEQTAPSPELEVFHRFLRAFSDRDWEALASRCAPEFAGYDHRLVGWGTVTGGVAFAKAMRSIVDLSADVITYVCHLRISPNVLLTASTWLGTRDGGEFELPRVSAIEFNSRGQMVRADIFDPHQHEQALARYQQVAASGFSQPATRFDNAAVTLWRELLDLWIQGDPKKLVHELPPLFHYSDRRHLVQLELNVEEFAAFQSDLPGIESSQVLGTLLGTRGDRLALIQIQTIVTDEIVGPSELNHLNLVEINERGELAALVRFDTDDLGAAYQELDIRFAAGEHAGKYDISGAYARAVADRNWSGMLEVCAPGMVRYDQRRLAVLGTAGNAQAWVDDTVALVHLAPDVRFRSDHVRYQGCSAFNQVLWHGTRDGGFFEIPFLVISHLNQDGRVREMRLYDLDQFDEAWSCFQGWAETEGPATPNTAAHRALERVTQLIEGRDWENLRALASEVFAYEDRGRRALVSGDIETWIASLSFLYDQPSLIMKLEPLGTHGDRVIVSRIHMSGGEVEAQFEINKFHVLEVDENGALKAILLFDEEDSSSAFLEAFRRFTLGEAQNAEIFLLMHAALASFPKHDWDLLATPLSPDFLMEDRRPLGLGDLDRETWMASLSAQAEMAPDLSLDLLSVAAWGAHGAVLELRTFGNLKEGGAFENIFYVCWTGRAQALDSNVVFAENDLPLAIAELEHRRPDNRE